MRKAWLVGLVITAALGSLAISLGNLDLAIAAPTIESTPVPAPQKPDFAPMKYLMGTWNCTSKSSRRPTASKFTTANSLDSTGYWIIGQDYAPGASWYPYATKGIDKMTYDSDSKLWIDVYTDDRGGYGISKSPGPHGNTIVWSDAYFTPYSDIVSQSPTTETFSSTKRVMHQTFRVKSGMVNRVDTVCIKTS